MDLRERKKQKLKEYQDNGGDYTLRRISQSVLLLTYEYTRRLWMARHLARRRKTREYKILTESPQGKRSHGTRWRRLKDDIAIYLRDFL